MCQTATWPVAPQPPSRVALGCAGVETCGSRTRQNLVKIPAKDQEEKCTYYQSNKSVCHCDPENWKTSHSRKTNNGGRDASQWSLIGIIGQGPR